VIRLFLVFIISMRIIPEYLDSDSLYWFMDSILMIAVCYYIWTKSVKTVTNAIITISAGVYLFSHFVDSIIYLLGFKEPFLLTYILYGVGLVFFYSLIAKNRYDWEKQRSADYNPKKVQAIYSKPSLGFSLLGAAVSLDPKCSVRYTYNEKTVRFKRGNPTPIMTGVVIKKTEIIENTNIDPECFYQRFDEIKNNKYNLFTFNCKHLFKMTYNNKVKELI
jgi:hypothetical protein